MPIVVDVVTQEEYEKWVAANERVASHEIKNVAELRESKTVEDDDSRFISQKIKSIGAPSIIAN